MYSQDNRISNFTIFETEGISNVEQTIFARHNLIIGKNGSGKTRFLKALEHDKKEHGEKKIIITLYFPEIQAFYNTDMAVSQEDASEDLAKEIYPYDLLLRNEDHSFYDFLKIMENDKGNFLENILTALSMKKTRTTAKAKQTIDELNELLLMFLEKKLCMKQDENMIYIEKIVNGSITRRLPLEESLSEFSPGELMLFYLCVFLMTIKQKSAKNVVLIIDEPELHLHPRALVKMVNTLKNFESVSELWIASHSLFLVPLFSFEEIVFMEHGSIISRNSQTYEELYNSLVGLENINVFEFLKSLNDWQYYQFIVECFCRPDAVEKIDIKDEQFCKLLETFKKNKNTEPIQMLDYGAGKFRIWECMQLLPDLQSETNNVIYTAYEPYPSEGDKKRFKLYTDFKDIYNDKKHFHVVVLMNVLHEIEPDKWAQTFKDIYNILTEDGVLVFLEVLSLTKGEQPYGNSGYLLLQNAQVKLLFNDDKIVNMRKDEKEKSNCWMITKEQVKNVTNETIKDSIESLRNDCYKILNEEFLQKVKYVHKQNDSQEKQMAARKYAFFSQQYINALLALKLIAKKSIEIGTGTVPLMSRKTPLKVTGIKVPSD